MTEPRRTAPRVLVSLLTEKRDDIDLVRRRIGYRRLVLLAHPAAIGIAEAVRDSETSAGDVDAVRMERFETADVHAHMERMKTVIAEEKERAGGTARIVLNAAGGDPALVMAMLLVAYEQGHETWFTQEGHHVRLPVLWGVRLEDRLEAEEATVLAALPQAGAPGAELAQRIVLARERVERAYRGLQRKGLVEVYAAAGRMAARPTEVGTYVQGHLGRR